MSETAPASTAAAKTGADYQFTVDWFSYNIPTWQTLVSALAPRRLIEIGCFEGRASSWLIEQCASRQPIELHCIDTWQGSEEFKSVNADGSLLRDAEARFDHNVATAMARVPHEVLYNKHKARSNEALVKILASGEFGGYDLIYIDGSHQAPDVLSDAVLAFELLRVGGLMIFDDYLWSMQPDGAQDPLNMPKPAIDAFINVFQRKMRVVVGAPLYQLYAYKTHP